MQHTCFIVIFSYAEKSNINNKNIIYDFMELFCNRIKYRFLSRVAQTWEMVNKYFSIYKIKFLIVKYSSEKFIFVKFVIVI